MSIKTNTCFISTDGSQTLFQVFAFASFWISDSMFFQIYIFLSILENVLLVSIMNPYWIIKWTPPLPPSNPRSHLRL